MVLEYSKDELKQMDEITSRYNGEISALVHKIETCEKGSQEHKALISDYEKLKEKENKELEELDKRAELREFKALGEDPDKILDDAVIRSFYALDDYLHESVALSDGTIKERHELEGYYLTIREARTIIFTELKKHVDFLKCYKKHLKRFETAIIKVARQCPFVVEKTAETSPAAREETAINKAAKKPLPPIRNTKIMNTLMVNNIISYKVDQIKEDDKGQLYMAFSTTQDINHQSLTTVSILQFGEALPPHILKKITAFDLSVLESVSNICLAMYCNGARTYEISLQEICRQLKGKADDMHYRPSAEFSKRVEASMEKLMDCKIDLNFKNEIEAMGKYEEYKELIESVNFRNTRLIMGYMKETKTTKNNAIWCYRILEIPILFLHSMMRNRLLTIPTDMFNSSDTRNPSKYSIEFTRYLAQQIALMYDNRKRGSHSNRDSNRILYSTIYEKTQIVPPEQRIDSAQYTDPRRYKVMIAKAAKADRDEITSILKSWTKKGYISGYDQAKKGSSYIGIDIKLSKREQLAISGQVSV